MSIEKPRFQTLSHSKKHTESDIKVKDNLIEPVSASAGITSDSKLRKTSYGRSYNIISNNEGQKGGEFQTPAELYQSTKAHSFYPLDGKPVDRPNPLRPQIVDNYIKSVLDIGAT